MIIKRQFLAPMLLLMTICMADCSKKGGPTSPDNPAITLSWLHTQGNRIVDENNEPMILRGVNRSGLEYDKDGAGISQAEIEYITSDWKAQIIRIPFNQEWITTDADYVSFLDDVIDWISGQGAYVLLDLQWRNTTVQIPPIPDEAAVDMWTSLAWTYRDNPAVLYDIHNEAHNTTWTDWRNRAIEIIEGIRSVHSQALIFVCGLDWAYDLRGWLDNPLPFDNIVYSTHPYPFKAEPWAWDKYFGDAADILPVFAGEFGGGVEDLEWGRQLLAYMDSKSMGWTSWSWSDNPLLTESDRRTPTAFGGLVRTALRSHGGVDSTALVISDIQISSVTSSRATVAWKTNVLSDSKVYFGTGTAYSDTLYAPASVTTHNMKLTGLAASTTYHFKVESRDAYTHVGTSSDSTFATTP